MGWAIETERVTKTYTTGVEALRGVSLSVGYGEIVAYLGRNGQGKSTTIRILSTLTTPTSGSARVAGHDVMVDPRAVRSAIGVTMQSSSLDPEMTGREHLTFVARLGGLPRVDAARRVREQIDAFSLGAVADRRIGTYSGGTQRRLDLASALVFRPSVVFLDEPTTGLDAQSRRALWDIVRDLRDDGAAVLLTTQYLEEADALADRVAIVEGGRLVATDTPSGLKRTAGVASLEEAFVRITGADPEPVPVEMEEAS